MTVKDKFIQIVEYVKKNGRQDKYKSSVWEYGDVMIYKYRGFWGVVYPYNFTDHTKMVNVTLKKSKIKYRAGGKEYLYKAYDYLFPVKNPPESVTVGASM